jgi:hypothetical protein
LHRTVQLIDALQGYSLQQLLSQKINREAGVQDAADLSGASTA